MICLRNVCMIAVIAALPAGAAAQQQQSSSQHGHHDPELLGRGRKGMGFDQLATTHHFLLREKGGSIEITANKAEDREAVQSIRQHLQHVQGAFSQGDFSIPMFVHGTEPPGAATLRARKETLTYRYVEIANGGRLEIGTTDPTSLSALHDFLRYQITEHKTGDRLGVR